MNELFNWGEESPEQRQARLQWEHELLLEQARMRFNMMAMTGGAAGGGGAPSGDRLECDPSKGIGLYVNAIDEETGEPTGLKYLGRLDYIGDINFRPAYRIDLISPEGFPITIHWDSTIDKWRQTSVIEGDTYYWLSDSLISSNWVAQQEAAGEEGSGQATDFTTCGYPELDRWCVEVDNIGGTVYNINAAPGWNNIETTETPNFWSVVVGFYIWDSDNSQWIIFTSFGDPTTAGDDINVLPEVTIGGVTITPSLGAC